MKELIGSCKSCSKEIFCLDGFLNGVVSNEKELYCFECAGTLEKENPQG